MWRLIKAELGYLRYFIYAVSVLILINGSSNPSSTYDYYRGYLYILYSPIETLRYEIAYLMPLHVIVIFVLLYLYLRESRLRQYAVIPVRKSQIVLARLATPFILAAIFIFMSLVPVLIYGVVFSEDMVTYFNIISPQYSNHYSWFGNSLYVDFGQHIAFICYTVQLMLFFTYALWLFSERFGWYLLGTYFAFVVYHDGILPLYNAKLAWAISNFIHDALFLTHEGSNIHVNLHLLYASIVFVILIAISFCTRRSFMR